jgi:hypothetical protein
VDAANSEECSNHNIEELPKRQLPKKLSTEESSKDSEARSTNSKILLRPLQRHKEKLLRERS